MVKPRLLGAMLSLDLIASNRPHSLNVTHASFRSTTTRSLAVRTHACTTTSAGVLVNQSIAALRRTDARRAVTCHPRHAFPTPVSSPTTTPCTSTARPTFPAGSHLELHSRHTTVLQGSSFALTCCTTHATSSSSCGLKTGKRTRA
jgi:hypothetical protein